MLSHVEDVRKLTPGGIQALVEALSYGGSAFHAHGWNPRPVEGFDHVFFYGLEKHTGKHFIHGYPVMLGIWLGSRLQKNRAAWVLDIVSRQLGIDIRPEAMHITWDDVRTTLLGLDQFSREQGFIYTHVPITAEWIEGARSELYAAYRESEQTDNS